MNIKRLVNNLWRVKSTICYIIFILLINYLFAHFPYIAVFGHAFASADLIVGFIYLLRDFSQREIGHYVIIAMLIGAGLSYGLASEAIAVASVTAFVIGESLDWLIYNFARTSFSKRLLWSSVISVPVDSFVFLYMINSLTFMQFLMMFLGKLLGVLLLWGAWRVRQKRIKKKAV